MANSTSVYGAHIASIDDENGNAIEYVDFRRLSQQELDEITKKSGGRRVSMMGQRQIDHLLQSGDKMADVNGTLISNIYNDDVDPDTAIKMIADYLDVDSGDLDDMISDSQMKNESLSGPNKHRTRVNGLDFLAVDISGGYYTFESDTNRYALVGWLNGDAPQLAVLRKDNDEIVVVLDQQKDFGRRLSDISMVKTSERIDVRIRSGVLGHIRRFEAEEDSEFDAEDADNYDIFSHIDSKLVLSGDALRDSDCFINAQDTKPLDKNAVAAISSVEDSNVVDEKKDHMVTEASDNAHIITLRNLF